MRKIIYVLIVFLFYSCSDTIINNNENNGSLSNDWKLIYKNIAGYTVRENMLYWLSAGDSILTGSTELRLKMNYYLEHYAINKQTLLIKDTGFASPFCCYYLWSENKISLDTTITISPHNKCSKVIFNTENGFIYYDSLLIFKK